MPNALQLHGIPNESGSSDDERWSNRSISPPYDPSEAVAYARKSEGRTSALGTDITDEISGVSETPVGYGGSADVYHGMWESQYGPMKVALKVLRIINPKDRRTLKLFRREISVWKKLLHPHIHLMCGLYTGLGSVPAMVSPWYDSGDINTYIRKHADDPEIANTKLALLFQVMHGLNYLHGKLIVHGDIKGGNVLVSDDGVARLSDFGLSAVLYRKYPAGGIAVQVDGRNVSLPSRLSHHSYIKGTCRWMAPELLTEDSPRQTFASDVWACGCLFIEVNGGIHPYHTKDNDYQVIVALADNEPPPRPDALSPIIYSLSLRCCRSQPDSRLSIKAIIQQLQEAAILASIVPTQSSDVVLLPSLAGFDFAIQESWSDFGRDCLACYQSMEGAISTLATSRAIEPRYLRLESVLSASDIGRFILNNIVQTRMSETSSWTAEQSLQSLISPRLGGSGSGPTEASCAVLNARIVIAASPSLKSRYPPAMLRLVAITIARKDKHLAEDLMRNFSSPRLRFAFRAHTCSVLSLAFLSDCRRVVSSSQDGTLRIWDIKTGETPIAPLVGHASNVRCVAVHESRVAFGSYDGNFRVWDADDPALVLGPITAHTGNEVDCIAYSKAGTHIATTGHDKCTAIWDAYTGVRWRRFAHPAPAMCVAFSNDGTRIVSGSLDSTVRVWDVISGLCINKLEMIDSSCVTAVRFSHDDKRVYSLSDDGAVRIWDAKRRGMISEPLRTDCRIMSMALSPDGKRLLTGSFTGRIAIWDAETGATIPSAFKDHEALVLCIAFSPDGRRIASTSGDKTVVLWDATDDWERYDVADEDVEEDSD